MNEQLREQLKGVDPERIAEWISTPSGFVEGCLDLNGEEICLDDWQRDFVDTEDQFSIWNKGRQVGWSFSAAARATSRSYLKPGLLSIFVSFNLDDAEEKIRYVNLLDASLPEEEKLRRVVDNKFEIEWVNPIDPSFPGSRIITQFKPRGKSKADVYLDELAHMQDAHGIYNAALPILTRGGAIFIASTPLAKAGKFFEIFTGAEGRFGKFKRHLIPWYGSAALCVDIEAARREAEGMQTAERVARFGTVTLQDIFDSMFLEDFQTEYECSWSDESYAFLEWALIELCSPTETPVYRVASIDELRACQGNLYGGMDIGRRKNVSEIHVGEETLGGAVELRLELTLDNKPFSEQQAILNRIMEIPNVKRFAIDNTGIGMQLAEQAAERWGSRIIEQTLSLASKPLLANNMRIMMEGGKYRFYPGRATRQEFHSVKKVVTASGNIIFDVDKNEKHHADRFWASALMLWAAKELARGRKPAVGIISFNEDEDEPQRKPTGTKRFF